MAINDFRVNGKALILTDVDDTLLPLGYRGDLKLLSSFLKRLRLVGVEVVPVTFKTFKELKNLMELLSFRFSAFIIEGGCVIYSSNNILRGERLKLGSDGYEVLELCKPISLFEEVLNKIEDEEVCRGEVLRLSKSSALEISNFLSLPLDVVRESQERYYSDAFITRNSLCKDTIREKIIYSGLKAVTTNRSVQVLGMDKEGGVNSFLKNLNVVGHRIPLIGVGDSSADYGFLGLVDIPILMSRKELGRFRSSQYIRSFDTPPGSWIYSVGIALSRFGISLSNI
ncbi:MAG: HAD-IIB family hydrolase [Sulfolobales archaeon]